jgi:hypothetical protein
VTVRAAPDGQGVLLRTGGDDEYLAVTRGPAHHHPHTPQQAGELMNSENISTGPTVEHTPRPAITIIHTERGQP